ncbi:MAG: hypothetical protein ACKOXQ_07835 [Hydrogenophaga sp.]
MSADDQERAQAADRVGAPVLPLTEAPGPTLTVDAAGLGSRAAPQPPHVVSVVFVALAALALLVLVPISRMDADALPVWERLGSLAGVLPGAGDQEEGDDEPDEPAAPAQAPAAADAPARASAGVWSEPALQALEGKYCFDFMPGGADAAAREAFARLLWNKLNDNLRRTAQERLDVCAPFEAVSADVVRAGGCRKSECGSNDVSFFISRTGHAAMAYNVDGQCDHAAEEGFTQTALLCRP